MSSEHVAIEVESVSKEYRVFQKPSHRLWQMLFGGARRFYRPHPVLRDISFKVHRGETVGVVGRNGCGKSTLLSILCGTLPPTSGKVAVRGRIAALLELGAGFNPELTGIENVELCAKIYGLEDKQLAERLQQIVDFADIGEYVTQPVKTYSSGMFTRLAFSVVAHVDADILVIDEALAVGDAYFVQKCMRFLDRFKASGGTLLFVSHDMGSVTSLCDRAIWLKDGGIAIDASPKQVANEYLADLYAMQQPTSASQPLQAEPERDMGAARDLEPYDPRRDMLLNSKIRNDIEVFAFKPGHDFGSGAATIERAAIVDELDRPLAWIVGGERVAIKIEVRAIEELRSAIVGFVVKDRQGQPLFGDNTYLSYHDAPVSVLPGGSLKARFDFRMPTLANGEYSISVAIADGSQATHIIHQWLHEAIVLASHTSSVSTGLIGIPMFGVSLQADSKDAVVARSVV
jgi:lipopolysaccharide transport system ATP-binding protein